MKAIDRKIEIYDIAFANPIFASTYPVLEIRVHNNSVLLAGPPPVIICTMSYARATSKDRIVMAMKIKGIKKGSVIFLKTCHELHPSTFAASIGSFGMPIKPAKSKIAKTDVLDQISAAIIDILAKKASTNQGFGLTPNSLKKLFSKPMLSLKIYFNRKPTQIGENIIENIISVINVFCAKVIIFIKKDIPSPNSNSKLKDIVRNKTVQTEENKTED